MEIKGVKSSIETIEVRKSEIIEQTIKILYGKLNIKHREGIGIKYQIDGSSGGIYRVIENPAGSHSYETKQLMVKTPSLGEVKIVDIINYLESIKYDKE